LAIFIFVVDGEMGSHRNTFTVQGAPRHFFDRLSLFADLSVYGQVTDVSVLLSLFNFTRR
jgi:hypothetical protein